ncbi:MAG: hypothetical protein R3A78_12320 [Polyangiales bacterium]|nr:hypothetical protein [Myxococcales bacterium]
MQNTRIAFLLVSALAFGGCDDAAKGPLAASDGGDSGTDGGDAGTDGGDAGEKTFSIGGTVTGLVGSGLVLQNNGADDLPIGTAGEFAFSMKLSAGAEYAVSIKSQPAAPETCELAAASGTIAGEDVTDVVVSCKSPYTIDQLVGDGVTGSLPTYKVGQTFLVPSTAQLAKIDVWAEARFAGVQLPSDTTVEIFAVSGGLPTGAPLATSDVVTVQAVAAMHSFSFATPATLTGGNVYAAIVTCEGSNEVNVGVDTTNPYVGGTLVGNIPTSPTVESSLDLRFQAFLQ